MVGMTQSYQVCVCVCVTRQGVTPDALGPLIILVPRVAVGCGAVGPWAAAVGVSAQTTGKKLVAMQVLWPIQCATKTNS